MAVAKQNKLRSGTDLQAINELSALTMLGRKQAEMGGLPHPTEAMRVIFSPKDAGAFSPQLAREISMGHGLGLGVGQPEVIQIAQPPDDIQNMLKT